MTPYFNIKRYTLLFCLALCMYSCFEDSEDLQVFVNSELSPTDTNNPNPFMGAMSPIETMSYNEIPTEKYIIELERWDIPNDRKDPERTTDNIQKAIDWAVSEGYGQICLPEGHYLIGKYGNDIYQAGIELKSNMAFLLDQNAIIEMAPNNKWNYCAITVTEKAHVVISGGTILGDRENHEYTPRKSDGSTVHDEGHLICIQNESEYVTVENVTLGKANGDAILLVGQKGAGSSVKHIDIRRNNMVDNRRQGVSIVGGTDVLIENNEIHHTKGTSPQFGIDVESLSYNSQDITIRNNYFHHNRGGDIVNTDGKNVIIENNILLQGKESQYIDGPIVYWKKGDLTIRNNDITMTTVSVNNWNGIIMYSDDSPKTNPATTYIYDNTCNNCGFYMYKGADLVVRDNYLNNGHLVFKEMTNLTLENNRVEHPQKCWAYRFLEVSGSANGNTYNGEAFDIPLQPNTPWDGCWIN
ncbi:right-handed parallel beta-helix repeat-containing protein [Flavivirga abyssicola]|uniref:right-handed parallel beta-helix repeat-containing protein n=1 Tax=Flavivirga abyssicola TaxID=3063533 RepID=UPI0026DF40FC|nr:right-handed parallel beta-helix repeat-containing protein [Flavivirga sp. MEBiC07777]WVK12931.1 right-handed parallel beta-helix repeat-containing protein [Flavivirga sp. MEBiC07777]